MVRRSVGKETRNSDSSTARANPSLEARRNSRTVLPSRRQVTQLRSRKKAQATLRNRVNLCPFAPGLPNRSPLWDANQVLTMKTILCSVASIALALGPLTATTYAAFHFSGRVVDVEGHPVAGAMVARYEFAEAWRQSWNARQDLTNQQLVATNPKALAGVVVDEADKPVSDAQVYVSMAITETALPGGARSFNHLLSGKIARNLFSARTGSGG